MPCTISIFPLGAVVNMNSNPQVGNEEMASAYPTTFIFYNLKFIYLCSVFKNLLFMNTIILKLVLTNKLITLSKKSQDYKPREGGDMVTGRPSNPKRKFGMQKFDTDYKLNYKLAQCPIVSL